MHCPKKLKEIFARAQRIGSPKSAPDLRGTPPVTEKLAHSGAEVRRVYIDGSKLEAGKKYVFNRVCVTINGDVPDNVSIKGKGGQLVVAGNVGDNVRFDLSVPEEYSYRSLGGDGHFEAIDLVSDGPKVPFDKDPVLVIQGKLGKDVVVNKTFGTSCSTAS